MTKPVNVWGSMYRDGDKTLNVTRSATLCCIQLGGSNGPIIQDYPEIEGRRVFHTGKTDLTGRASITIGNLKFTGRLIPSHA